MIGRYVVPYSAPFVPSDRGLSIMAAAARMVGTLPNGFSSVATAVLPGGPLFGGGFPELGFEQDE